MKNIFKKKAFLVLASVALLLTIAVSSTLAFLTDRTESVTNIFTPTNVDVTVTDTVDGGVKRNVVITNTGNIDAYIRAKVVANWRLNGEIVGGWTDDITYNTSKWTADNGFYYYADPVAPGAYTPVALFNSYEPTQNPPVAGAQLVMDIIVQAVQADGTGATNAPDAFSKIATTH